MTGDRLGVRDATPNHSRPHMHAVSYHDQNPPLPPDDAYPLEYKQEPLTWRYYVAFALAASVWAVTPGSYVFLGWYIHALWTDTTIPSRILGIPSILLAGWAVVEVVFSRYYFYLSRWIQPESPPSTIPPDALSDLFIRVLNAGLLLEPTKRMLAAFGNGNFAPPPLAPKRPRVTGRLDSGIPTTLADLANEDDVEIDPLFDEFGKPRVLDKDDPRAIEFREQLRTWFHHVPWEDLKRDDVCTWLAWSCFNMPLPAVRADPKRHRFLERTCTMLEARTGTTFQPGNAEVPVMRLTLDPINVMGRPFLIYALTNGINWFLQSVLYPMRGVSVVREGDIDFLVRIPPGWTPEQGRSEYNAMPIVYLHGLGFGLLQNHALLHHLVVSLPTHPLLVPLAHHTSQSIFSDRHLKPWTRPQLVKTLKAVLQKYEMWRPGDRASGVSLLSHSNGSVHHGWVLKDAPEIVKRSTFVDPVVFNLWEGDVCFNFCYRKPRRALELLLYYFIASEVGIAHYINRHFNWCDNTLFVEDIPNATNGSRTAVFLGGEDIIIDAKRTRKYLERNGLSTGVHWDAHAGHGDGLMGESRDRVVMFAGTGSTRGWQNWLTRGRRSHSLGQNGRPTLPIVTPSSNSSTDVEGEVKPPRRRRAFTKA